MSIVRNVGITITKPASHRAGIRHCPIMPVAVRFC